MNLPPAPDADVVARGLSELLKRLAVNITAFTVVAGAAWYMSSPRLEPLFQLPQKVDAQAGQIQELTTKVDSVIGIGPPPPVEYRDYVFVEPPTGSIYPLQTAGPPSFYPGQTVRLHYTVHRRVECPAEIEHRFWNASDNTLDSQHVTRSPTVTFPVTAEFQEFVERLVLPPTLSPGLYAYRPRVFCPDLQPVTRPPAYFRIVQRDASAKPPNRAK